MTQPADADLTGQNLGEFHVLRRLGQGGMGQVYLAEQVTLKRKVALKLLRPELAANEVALKRFQAEAENVARATHANIVQVYAIGEAGGIHFMALEYVDGRNLRQYLEKKGPPDVLVGLGIMRQVALALGRASELGIIHRDIKPENILLTRAGEVKVADFGLARVFEASSQPLHLTQSGVVVGTPLYMSPEQVEGKPLDPRSDVYSFGVTSYHMFAGEPPFKGQSPFEVALQHVQKEPPPLQETRPDLPAELCAFIHKMMAKKPEERYQTCREIVRDISRLRDAVVGVGPAGSGVTQALADTATMLPGPPSRRINWTGWALGLSCVLALGLGLYLGQSQGPATMEGAKREEAGKEVMDLREREEYLRRTVAESIDLRNPVDTSVGMKFSTELGLLLLADRSRLADAEAFFADLDRPGRIAHYRVLGKLGRAIALAFKDEPAESNRLFLEVLNRDKLDKMPAKASYFWRDNPAWAEMMARALNHNYTNAPKTFPAPLEVYRRPPAPVMSNAVSPKR